MAWQVSPEERTYLRELAKKQAEYAALLVMAERKKMWYDLNDGLKNARPPVIIETGTFDRDFMPESIYKCKSDAGKNIERQLLRNVRNHELINDDKVMPDTFNMGWFFDIDEFGVKIERETVKDSQGFFCGYKFLHPIKDLKRDMHILQPAKFSVDRKGTLEYKAFLDELLGDVLPVKLVCGIVGTGMLTHRVVELMGMETFFISMCDVPDEVHKLMSFLRDNSLSLMRWAEKEKLMVLNNGNDTSFGSSFNFTKKLPAPGYDAKSVRLRDMWGAANSQETVGISPAMFHEFCFPYYRDVCEPMGLMYYGCCEPAHPYWDDISKLPHLKKVSISRWCDEKFMGEALRGTNIIFSRKPHPNMLGVDVKLNEEAWSAHIRETLKAAKGVAIEFIVRDVYTVHGDLNKPRRCVELAHAEIDKHYR